MDGASGSYEEKRNAYKVLVGRTEGKGPLGIPRCRWECNIKPNPEGISSEYGKITGFEHGLLKLSTLCKKFSVQRSLISEKASLCLTISKHCPLVLLIIVAIKC